MKFKCFDYFMIRTPGLPIQYLDEYENQEKDIYEFISSNMELDLFFKKALYISSQSLYKTYINRPIEEKRYEKLKSALLKFFVRSVSRTTPYGYFASVGLGEFGKKNSFLKQNSIIDIRADSNWVNKLIHYLENDQEIYEKLRFRFNDLCFKSGDRMKNPYYTNYGQIQMGEKITTENSIKYSNLVHLIQQESTSFVTYSRLYNVIKKSYNGVTDTLISKTIRMLLDNEFLFSNLREPVYCENALTHIVNELQEMQYTGQYLCKLREISKLINEYKLNKEQTTLENIYELMSKLYKSENYVMLNSGNQFQDGKLTQDIKQKVEELVNFLYKIPVTYDPLSQFKERFSEKFGINIEVPIFVIIDKNDFNGLPLFKLNEVADSEDEQLIEEIINNKIFEGIINQKDEIFITEEDLKRIALHNTECIKTFDLNFIITLNKGKPQIHLAPGVGNDKAGAMFQRFSLCMEPEKMEKYNQIYDKERNLYLDEYLLVEAREQNTLGKGNNIVNCSKNYKYYISFGNCSDGSEEAIKEEITLDDLSIGMTKSMEVYIKSNKHNKKIKIINDNMLNPQHNNPILKMLKSISKAQEQSIGSRLVLIRNNQNYKYMPRIIIKDIIISPKKWMLDENDFDFTSFEGFVKQFDENKKRYHIDCILYQEVHDNRLIVDTSKTEYLKILYSEYKKNKRLTLTEIEKGVLDNAIVKDCNGGEYIGEYVFSLLMEEHEKSNYYIQSDNNILLCEKQREKILCEDGWVYFKLYGTEERENEVISIYLPKLLQSLNCPKHFFIRYADKDGNHVRTRFKFFNRQIGFQNLPLILEWAEMLKSKKLINNIIFDTYERETNRYGGEEVIESCEEVFAYDSLTVETILSKYEISDEKVLEKCYIFGIVNILKNLTDNIEEMFTIIDSRSFEGKYRDVYRRNQKEYLLLVQELLDEDIEKHLDIFSEYKDEKEALHKFRKKLNKQIERQKNTNSKETIVLSIIHMFCNRFTGKRIYEDKYSEIVRDALYHIMRKKVKGVRREEVDENVSGSGV